MTVYFIEWTNGDSYQVHKEILCACSSAEIAQSMIDEFFEWRQKLGESLSLLPGGEERQEYFKRLRDKTIKAPFGWGLKADFLDNSEYIDMTEFWAPELVIPPEDWVQKNGGEPYDEPWYDDYTYTIKATTLY